MTHWPRASKVLKQAFVSFLLSGLTIFAISRIDRLPYSPTWVRLSDALEFPGYVIAGLFYPQGIHAGHGSIGWAYVAVSSLVLFYSVLWFVMIRILNWLKGVRH